MNNSVQANADDLEPSPRSEASIHGSRITSYGSRFTFLWFTVHFLWFICPVPPEQWIRQPDVTPPTCARGRGGHGEGVAERLALSEGGGGRKACEAVEEG